MHPTEGESAGDHARAAVGNEWQGHAGVGQATNRHAKVHDGLRDDHDRAARGEHAASTQIRLTFIAHAAIGEFGCLRRNLKTQVQDQCEHHKHSRNADGPSRMPNRTDHEIGGLREHPLRVDRHVWPKANQSGILELGHGFFYLPGVPLTRLGIVAQRGHKTIEAVGGVLESVR